MKHIATAHLFFRGLTTGSLLLVLFFTSATFGQSASQMWVTGYYPTWAPCSMPPEAINYTGLTHLVHFSANPITSSPPYLDVVALPSDSANMENCGSETNIVHRLVTNAHKNGVKVLLSLGGIFGPGATNMNWINSDSARTDTFATAAVAYAARRGYDGVEVDWEPPSSAAASGRLFRILRRELNTWSTRGQLAVAVADNDKYHGGFSGRYDLQTMVSCVDQSNIMMYDFNYTPSYSSNTCGSTDVTGFNAPLHQPGSNYPTLSQYSWNYDPGMGNAPIAGPQLWNSQGMPFGKMAPGIPFYGYFYKGRTAPNQPRCPSYPQYIPYSTILSALGSGGTYHWDDTAKVPWISGTATAPISGYAAVGDQFYITFDDTLSIAEKVKWAKALGFGGIMIYELWQGWVPNAAVKDPLLRTVVKTIGGPSPPPSSTPRIRGQIFFDRNSNGVRDPGEPGLAGWTVYLVSGLKTDSTVTNAQGAYSFTNLPVGAYIVSENLRSLWTLTTLPTSFAVTILSATDDVTASFGNYVPNVFDFASGWNLVSLPARLADTLVSSVLPTAVRQLVFTSANKPVQAMTAGVGYWGQFPSAVLQPIVGGPLPTVSVSLTNGWSLIGSVDHAVPVPQGGIVSASVYGFDNGYFIAQTLVPGKGYWIKADSAGTVTLGGSSAPPTDRPFAPHSYDSITFADNAGSDQTLYLAPRDVPVTLSDFELPPLPPAGVFDVRFASQRFVEAYPADASTARTYPIQVRSPVPPLTVSYSIAQSAGSSVILTETSGQNVIATHQLDGAGTLTLDGDPSAAYALSIAGPGSIPREFTLNQNYPNPFNNGTVIPFALPSAGRVRLAAFNLLGEVVVVLVDKVLDAGSYAIPFNAGKLPSGVYFYKVEFTPSSGALVSRVSRMILMK